MFPSFFDVPLWLSIVVSHLRLLEKIFDLCRRSYTASRLTTQIRRDLVFWPEERTKDPLISPPRSATTPDVVVPLATVFSTTSSACVWDASHGCKNFLPLHPIPRLFRKEKQGCLASRLADFWCMVIGDEKQGRVTGRFLFVFFFYLDLGQTTLWGFCDAYPQNGKMFPCPFSLHAQICLFQDPRLVPLSRPFFSAQTPRQVFCETKLFSQYPHAPACCLLPPCSSIQACLSENHLRKVPGIFEFPFAGT